MSHRRAVATTTGRASAREKRSNFELIEGEIARGSVGIDNAELLEFLLAHRDGSATLILVRQTPQIEGAGPGLTHTFASDFHPEAVGPLLEFSLKN